MEDEGTFRGLPIYFLIEGLLTISAEASREDAWTRLSETFFNSITFSSLLIGFINFVKKSWNRAMIP